MGFIIENESDNFAAVEMDFKIEAGGTTIQLRDPATLAVLEVQPANTLEAVANGLKIRIQLLGGEKIIIDGLEMATTSINGIQVTQVQATAINELNSLFYNTSGVSGSAPIVTGGTSQVINSVVGANINFQVSGTGIVAINWDFSSLPAGHDITVINSGNHTAIIGSTDSTIFPAGTYSLSFTCVNFWGSTTVNVSLIKGTTFTNTYSFSPNSGGTAFLQKTASGSENDTPLYRAAGNTGQPWTVFGWLKNNAGSSAWKPVFYFGDYSSGAGGTNLGRVRFHIRNSTTWPYNTIELYFSYGDATNPSTNGIKFSGLAAGVSKNTWFSFMVVYDGGNTNTGSATSADPFSIYINGVQLSPSWTVTGGGYGGSIEYTGFNISQFSIGRGEATGATKYANVTFFDEMALWQSDQSANAATFHNSGTPIDLNPYNPYSYIKFGDGSDISNWPIVEDLGTTGTDLTMYNGNITLFVSDTP